MEKFKAMEAKIEDKFPQVHSKLGELGYGKLKEQIDGVKKKIDREFLGSYRGCSAGVKGVQRFKEISQEMLDRQTNLIQKLQSEVKNVRNENVKLRLKKD